MQTRSQEEIEFIKEQLRTHDLANVDFDIDFGGIGDNKGADYQADLKEIKQYLERDILKSDMKHLNELTSFFFEEEHHKNIDCVKSVEVLFQLDETGVFGHPKLFDVLKFNAKEFVVKFFEGKNQKELDHEAFSGLILDLAKVLAEKC